LNNSPLPEEKSAVTFFMNAIESAPPGTTANCISNVARKKADEFAKSPTSDSADRVSNAARDKAAENGASIDDVAIDARDEATKIGNEGVLKKTAADETAKAAEDAAKANGANANYVKDAAAAKAGSQENTDEPRKSAANRVAEAAGTAAAQPGATHETVRNAATDKAKQVADEANAEIDAANAVADAAKAESAKSVESIKNTADTAVLDAAPLPKARLIIDNLNLESANEGAWGNGLRLRIDYDVPSEVPESYKTYGLTKDDLFNVTVRDCMTGMTEVFRNATVKPSPRKIDEVLKNESNLVRVQGEVVQTRPANSNDGTAVGQKVWEDNNPPTNYIVTEKASDGSALDKNDFTERGEKKGLYALEKTDLFNMLCIPPFLDTGDIDKNLIDPAATYCENRRAFLLIDPPIAWTDKGKAKDGIDGSDIGSPSKNAALFFPRLLQANPLRNGQMEDFVPCGTVAGVFARTDSQRGAWKAPAGLDATLVGVPKLSVSLTDAENGELNPKGINCLRAFPAAGCVVWGARTRVGDDRRASEWKYIPVRRLALFIEESLYRGTQWVVFEPNDEPLWSQIRLNVGSFMHNLFCKGAFQGKTPREAYLVKCDRETTTQDDINKGIVNILVGFAPLKPAEFVFIKIQQLAGKIQT
jgi:phage tail sheath protein FI